MVTTVYNVSYLLLNKTIMIYKTLVWLLAIGIISLVIFTLFKKDKTFIAPELPSITNNTPSEIRTFYPCLEGDKCD